MFNELFESIEIERENEAFDLYETIQDITEGYEEEE